MRYLRKEFLYFFNGWQTFYISPSSLHELMVMMIQFRIEQVHIEVHGGILLREENYSRYVDLALIKEDDTLKRN